MFDPTKAVPYGTRPSNPLYNKNAPNATTPPTDIGGAIAPKKSGFDPSKAVPASTSANLPEQEGILSRYTAFDKKLRDFNWSLPGNILKGIVKEGTSQVLGLGKLGESLFSAPLKAAGVVPEDQKTGTEGLQEQFPVISDENLKAKNIGEGIGKVEGFIASLFVGPGEAKGANVGSDITKAGAEFLANVSMEGAKKNLVKNAGKVAQGAIEDTKKTIDALSHINTEGVKTWQDLVARGKNVISTYGSKLGEMLVVFDSAPKQIDQFNREIGKGKFVNYVIEAGKGLKELYHKTINEAGIKWIDDLEKKAATEGLTRREVNELAQRYGYEKSAFSPKTGQPLTSTSAEMFENFRKGLKGLVRDGAPEAVKKLDDVMSKVFTVVDNASTQAEIVNKAANRIVEDKNLLGKVANAVGKVMGLTLDATGVKRMIAGMGLNVFKQGEGPIAIRLEKTLQKNLLKIDEALGKKGKPFEDAVLKYVDDMMKAIKEERASKLGLPAPKEPIVAPPSSSPIVPQSKLPQGKPLELPQGVIDLPNQGILEGQAKLRQNPF